MLRTNRDWLDFNLLSSTFVQTQSIKGTSVGLLKVTQNKAVQQQPVHSFNTAQPDSFRTVHSRATMSTQLMTPCCAPCKPATCTDVATAPCDDKVCAPPKKAVCPTAAPCDPCKTDNCPPEADDCGHHEAAEGEHHHHGGHKHQNGCSIVRCLDSEDDL